MTPLHHDPVDACERCSAEPAFRTTGTYNRNQRRWTRILCAVCATLECQDDERALMKPCEDCAEPFMVGDHHGVINCVFNLKRRLRWHEQRLEAMGDLLAYPRRAIHMVSLGEWTSRKALQEILLWLHGCAYQNDAYLGRQARKDAEKRAADTAAAESHYAMDDPARTER